MIKRFFLAIALLTPSIQSGVADDASNFFNKYNSQDSNTRMQCPDNDNKTMQLFTARDGNLFLNGGQIAQVKQNGKKQQYYITGIIWDIFVDFENKLLIQTHEGEELNRKECR